MKAATIKIIIAGLLAGASLQATTFPLSENSWNNPEFVQRFLGSYGFDTATTPSITSEERVLFETITPFIASNPQEAITRIRAALKPDSSRALHYTLGNLYFQTGNIPAAISSYEEAIKGFPNFLRAYKNLGIVYVQEGEYEKGIKMLLKTIQLGGQDADVFGLTGFSYLNTGNAAAALRAYEQALFFAPNSRDWRMGKVQALSNLRRYRDAIAMIDDLLVDFPGQTDLLLLQANAFIALNEPEDAAAALEIVRAAGRPVPTP
ncbi:MAG: tetratricopeptide repeat protein [Verrucomicrobia bacterium]|nr:tetratricopeptide repeat protein [Verrucomicrobiota bacterium]